MGNGWSSEQLALRIHKLMDGSSARVSQNNSSLKPTAHETEAA